MAKQKLPTPRLQLRWEESGRTDYRWQCHYELVILLSECDVRREIYKNGRQLRRMLPRELAIPMKPPSMRSSSNPHPPCTAADGRTRFADDPFRDGAHARWDAAQLGGHPIFVIAPDGKPFRIEYDPEQFHPEKRKRHNAGHHRP